MRYKSDYWLLCGGATKQGHNKWRHIWRGVRQGPADCSQRDSDNLHDIAHRPFQPTIMDIDSSGSGGWRFAQCFGDKGEVEDITEGTAPRSLS